MVSHTTLGIRGNWHSIGRWVVWAIVLVWVGLWVSRPINLITADLGRHLKNGEVILREGLRSKVLTSNYYSYTYPDFPAVNHHWLYGVFSQLLWRVGSFTLLSLVNVLMIVIAVWLMMRSAAKSANWLVVGVATVAVLPLLVSRTEVRPESVSFLMASIYWLLLSNWRSSRRIGWLLPLLPLQAIWANTHIFFPFGWLVIGAFLMESLTVWVLARDRQTAQKQLLTLSILGAACVGISLLNPFGWKLIAAPFTIFANYNYLIVENQSPLFLMRLNVEPVLHIYAVLLMAGLLLSLMLITKSWRTQTQQLPTLIIVSMLLAGSWRMMRLYPYLGLFAIPLLTVAMTQAGQLMHRGKGWRSVLTNAEQIPLVVLLGVVVIVGMVASGLYWPNLQLVGWGLAPHSTAAAEFYQSLALKGHVFNNYDSGGYLIYYLPPQSVFVDNRPAEYPSSFFDRYKKAQEDPQEFMVLSTHSDLQSVFFYRHDLTPWAQAFLVSMIDNPDWVPIYVDEYSIIFVKNTPEHAAIIEQYRLPKELFRVSQSV